MMKKDCKTLKQTYKMCQIWSEENNIKTINPYISCILMNKENGLQLDILCNYILNIDNWNKCMINWYIKNKEIIMLQNKIKENCERNKGNNDGRKRESLVVC